MILEWLANGDLPPGVHFATWLEIENRLIFNPRRQRLLAGFRQACEELRKAGCRLVYLDGSFVTRKEHPGDFDACWDIQNVDEEKLHPVFWDFSQVIVAQWNTQQAPAAGHGIVDGTSALRFANAHSRAGPVGTGADLLLRVLGPQGQRRAGPGRRV